MSTRVLIVDDAATIRAKLSITLVANGFEVQTANDGSQALELLAPGHAFDVIISDLRMPGVDGCSLITKLQSDPDLALLPVVIITASEEKLDHLRNLEAGASAYLLKPWDDEVLIATVRRLAKQKLRQVELAHDSRTDPLTGLNNRRFGVERLNQEIERCRRYGGSLTVAMIDIDHFKRVNDTLGHAAGDDVLVKVSSELRRVSRATDLVLRWGGEEFLFAFAQTDLVQAAGIVERFRAQLAGAPVAVRAAGVDVPVTVSGGVATLEADDTLDTLVDRADSALYKAKESGRNRLLMWQLGRLSPVAAA
ncbi:MAG TPA: diguanylate cyclase [Planctomycetota bacterium]|nr:diguanylate cyclase [Planctomycetota bacterium]